MMGPRPNPGPLHRRPPTPRDTRREDLARELLLILVEANPHDHAYNVRTAVEYADDLFAELEKVK